ncbi:hypothetical protein DKG77_07445 [Flagellimonas aquimarina]|uniref:PNPLA domain-containing protein n=1 Tax=Flagellimonas aquimarina TaxID=2201895 RepID=A0A316KZJ1_9FLAO|nr:hypothetical protein [Allomuricauda koreensis]PWL38119.1 hypothetical protein DKG77_07445 [Allomuricauda koreensis]
MLFIWLSKKENWPLIFWVLLSLAMLICPSFFWINDYITTPQHGHFDCFETVSEIIQKPENSKNRWWYEAFFVLDFVWAFFTLTLIGMAISKTTFRDFFRFNGLHWSIKIYVILASIAYLADVTEGILYLTYTFVGLQAMVYLKIGAYVICLLFFLYWLLQTFIVKNFKSFLRFVNTSLVSLFFIATIYLLITLMPQGGTLVVQLFYNPPNIVIFFFLLMFLSLILSHYPIYTDIWSSDINKEVRLRMDSRLNLLGFGIIYYDTSGLSANSPFRNPVVLSFRRSLGLLLYVAVFNIMFGVISRYFEVHFNVLKISLFVFAVTVFIYYLEGMTHKHWTNVLYGKGVPPATLNKNIGYILSYVRWFPHYFLLCVLGAVLVAILASELKWHRHAVLLFMIVLGLQMFLYIMFKISRAFLKYVFITKRLYFKNRTMYDDRIARYFIAYYRKNPNKRPRRLFMAFGNLSDNITYLRLMRFSGILSLAVIFWANYSVPMATFLNPIVVILFYIILIYSLFMIIFKHLLYYGRNTGVRFRRFFRFGIPLMLILIIAAANYGSRQSNDLHELNRVVRKTDMDFKTYLKSRMENHPGNGKENYFFIGSYGGGLKANLWNLLLLNELDSIYREDFFSKTLVVSGVSGGAVGIGNYTSLVAHLGEAPTFYEEIFKIGRSNVLSNELVYLLGRDWLREYNPYYSHHGTDRSYRSMEVHAKLTQLDSFNTKGLEDVWREAYENRDGQYPLLILNSTGVGGQQGVATSVPFPDDAFPGALITNKFKKADSLTLTYYGAVSTTNRFPIFSPTAKIKEKGAFIDGGYFENSGLLSAMEVYDAMAKDGTLEYTDNVQPIFINIINSKDFYVKQKLKEYKLEPNAKTDPSEYQSIIETITSTNILPYYILEKLKARGFAVELIMMPHKISLEDVESSMRGEVEDPIAIMDKLKLHNDSIDDALNKYQLYDLKNWGVVEPPLARLLSVPAARYQQAMVKEHPLIREKIDFRIKEYIKSKIPVDTTFQYLIRQVEYSPNIYKLKNGYDEAWQIKKEDSVRNDSL